MKKPPITEERRLDKLSSHLFWDVDKAKLEWQKDDLYIIGRVLEFGLWSDWEMIKKVYGMDWIARKVVNLRSLDDVTLSFLCLIFNLEPQAFRCYRLKQSSPNFWNY